MPEYTVRIIESFSKCVTVEAASEEQAAEIAETNYFEDEYDMCDAQGYNTEFECLPGEMEL